MTPVASQSGQVRFTALCQKFAQVVGVLSGKPGMVASEDAEAV